MSVVDQLDHDNFYSCSLDVFKCCFLLCWGPYIKDLRTGRGEGASPKADIVREVAWIYSYRSSHNADKGGGEKNPENFADVLYVGPLRLLMRCWLS